jgi:hypothetical protein
MVHAQLLKLGQEINAIPEGLEWVIVPPDLDDDGNEPQPAVVG